MPAPHLCSIVVTYHPDREVLANLNALCAQPGKVVVLDNGSEPDSLALLREASGRLGFTLVEYGENLGIATALNRGVRWAEARGAEWVLLFDQDSCVTDGFIDIMLREYRERERLRPLGLLAPTYRDLRFGSDISPERLAGGGLALAMTSGSMLRMETFRTCGFFVDELFIDLVDHEYSLRLRAAGYTIEECPAVLLHSPGTPRYHRWLGQKFETAKL